MVVRAQLGRILLGNRAGAGRFAAVCVAGALCLELVYAPWLDGKLFTLTKTDFTVGRWFNDVNAGRSYQSVLPQILAQQANMASDDDEEEDEDDE